MKQLLAITVIVFLSACASSPDTIGKFASQESKAFEKISDQYNEGEKASKAGEKIISKGRKLVEKGRGKVREGEEMIFNGNQMIQTSRDSYAVQTGYVSTPVNPSEIQADTEELKVLLKNWSKGIESVKSGNKLIASGNEMIDKGEAQIREGRAKSDYGKSLMRDAEAAYNSKRSNFSSY